MCNNIAEDIKRLKEERKAVILAHNYVSGDIQDIADFCGDSLELAFRARDARAEVIVCCGVRFMAETAKLLSPEATVLLPEPDAGCPMADMADAQAIKSYRDANPDSLLVAYVNTTAAAKALVDVCCTSGNVDRVLASFKADEKTMFLPDKNLGENMNIRRGTTMRLWEGCCPVHDAITPDMIREARRRHPAAVVLIHPECRPETLAESDHALSTSGILKFAAESTAAEFIIATETGMLHRLRKENPGKKFFSLSPETICPVMKMLTLEKVRDALMKMSPAIELPEDVMRDAVLPIERMLSVK